MSAAIILLLGVVFLIAGTSKLASPDSFRATLRRLLPQGHVRPASRAIPGMEIVLGVLLMSGTAPRLTAAASILVLLVFGAVLLRMWRRGVSGCGCFGEAADSAPSGLARNVILIALALLVVLPAEEPRVWPGDAPILIGQLTLVLGALCAWPCVVAVSRRRKMIFSMGGLR